MLNEVTNILPGYEFVTGIIGYIGLVFGLGMSYQRIMDRMKRHEQDHDRLCKVIDELKTDIRGLMQNRYEVR